MWLKRIHQAFRLESEIWISYLLGQQIDSFEHLKEARPKHKGILFRVLIWTYLLFKRANFQFYPKKSECRVVIYSGTHNQRVSLQSTVKSLHQKNEKFLAIAPSKLKGDDHFYTEQKLSYIDVFKVLFIFSLRAPSLFRQLRRRNPVLIRNHLHSFLNIYTHLVYYEKLLRFTKPEFVVVSNDHNVSNRSLLLMSKVCGIKTVYMQHASVSKYFPALTVDYAFLDGQSSLDIYRKCKVNSFNNEFLVECKAFLSGQKKELKRNQKKNDDFCVGYALNALDSVSDIEEIVRFIESNSLKVKLRWHPALGLEKINILKEVMNLPIAQYSDPTVESISDFLCEINCLIAGNSSIHLEAALSDIVPIYYEPKPVEHPDYYGYVKAGVCMTASSPNELIMLIRQIQSGMNLLNTEAIRYFSSTYATRWQGKEGDIITEFLTKGEVPEDIQSVIV